MVTDRRSSGAANKAQRHFKGPRDETDLRSVSDPPLLAVHPSRRPPADLSAPARFHPAVTFRLVPPTPFALIGASQETLGLALSSAQSSEEEKEKELQVEI